jgi:hypothetical protein
MHLKVIIFLLFARLWIGKLDSCLLEFDENILLLFQQVKWKSLCIKKCGVIYQSTSSYTRSNALSSPFYTHRPVRLEYWCG